MVFFFPVFLDLKLGWWVGVSAAATKQSSVKGGLGRLIG
jgi:hypothetical protein